MRRNALSRGVGEAGKCLDEACRLLELADMNSVVTAGRRFAEAASLLQSRGEQRSIGPAEAVQLRRATARAGRLLDALGAWRLKIAALLSSEDTSAPGYAANGKPAGASAPGSLAVVG